MNFIQTHNKAFRAEWLKLRHSGMVWMLLGAAIFIPLINTIIGLLRDGGAEGKNVWDMLIQTNFTLFTFFFFPMFVVVMVTRLVYTEHRYDTWKLLETQPVTRFAIYGTKWEVAALISLLTLLGVLAFSLLNGTVLLIFRKDYNMSQQAPDMARAFGVLLRFWIASLGIVSLQYFLSLMIRSFVWPMIIGLVAIIAGNIFAEFGVLSWFPYSATGMTARSFEGSMAGNFLLHHERMSLLWAALFLWLGYRYFMGKGLVRAFLLPARQGLVTAVLLGVFVALAWWVNNPVTLGRYERTVLSGTFKTEQKINSVAVLQAPANDTLVVIPVRDGKFHAVIPQPLDAGVYTLRAGTQRAQVFMGTNDSTYLDWEIKDKLSKVTASGTRVAENAYLKDKDQPYSWALTENAYKYDPKEYTSRMIDEWEDWVAGINKFKTVDNIRPAADFLDVQKKLVTVYFLNLADNYYPQVYSIYNPNDKLEYPKSMEKLRQVVRMDDAALIAYPDYRNYVTEYFRTKSQRNDSLFFYYVNAELKSPKVKDYLVYEAAQTNMARIKDSTRRQHLLQNALASFSNTRLKGNLQEQAFRLANLQSGRKAYNFSAEALNGKQITLSQLAGRYIVVDVWATWCAPCKKENPVFDELAERYTSERVAFVSLSVDEDPDQWRMKSARRSNKVLQLRAAAGDEEFSRHYAIQTIPRFILIDPKGNIVNADLPRPSEAGFEETLLKEIAGMKVRQADNPGWD